jgi:hypothetical protein
LILTTDGLHLSAAAARNGAGPKTGRHPMIDFTSFDVTYLRCRGLYTRTKTIGNRDTVITLANNGLHLSAAAARGGARVPSAGDPCVRRCAVVRRKRYGCRCGSERGLIEVHLRTVLKTKKEEADSNQYNAQSDSFFQQHKDLRDLRWIGHFGLGLEPFCYRYLKMSYFEPRPTTSALNSVVRSTRPD